MGCSSVQIEGKGGRAGTLPSVDEPNIQGADTLCSVHSV